MLSVSLDSAGWTTVTPGPSSRVYYVSSSQGNDFNAGTSPDAPLRSIAKAKSLMTSGAGDQMLLKRGDTFHETFGFWNISGAGSTQPTVIGAYGSGARPDVETGAGFGLVSGTAAGLVHDIAVIGIRFHSDGHDPSSPTFNDSARPDGFSIVGGVANFLIEDCSIEDYTNNLVFQDYYGPVSNIQIRRSQVLDAYNDQGHSQGLYAEGVDGILLEDNVFDHNGWNESKSGAGATIFNHDAYIQARSNDLVARGNIFADASSHGLQARCGGVVSDNVFLNDAIGLSFGLVNGAGPVHDGGVFGRVNDNAFVGGKDISGQPRGLGIEIANISPSKATSIDNNLFAQGVQGGLFAAINLGYGKGTFQRDQVGINDLTIRNNTVYGWAHGLYMSPDLHLGGSGMASVNGLRVTDNDFQNMYNNGWIIYHGPSINANYETWTNNRYGSLNGTPANYRDPNRTLSTYDLAIGGVGTIDHFVAMARGESHQSWQPQYTAKAVIGYLKTGYADPTDPTPITLPPSTYPPYVPPPSNIPWIPPTQRPTDGGTGGGSNGGSGGDSGGGNNGGNSGGSSGGNAGGGDSGGTPAGPPVVIGGDGGTGSGGDSGGTPGGAGGSGGNSGGNNGGGSGGTVVAPDPFQLDPSDPTTDPTGGGLGGGVGDVGGIGGIGGVGGSTGSTGTTAEGSAPLPGSDPLSPGLPPLPSSFPTPATTGGTTGGTGGTTGGTTGGVGGGVGGVGGTGGVVVGGGGTGNAGGTGGTANPGGASDGSGGGSNGGSGGSNTSAGSADAAGGTRHGGRASGVAIFYLPRPATAAKAKTA